MSSAVSIGHVPNMCNVLDMERTDWLMVNPRLPQAVQQEVREARLRLETGGRRAAWGVLGRALLNAAGAGLAALGLSEATVFFPLYPLASAVPAVVSVIFGGFCATRCVAAAQEVPDVFGARRARRVLDRAPGSYIELDHDFDHEAHRTWAPLVSAVQATDLSAPYADGIEARLFLPGELWDIAQQLADQSRLRRRRGSRLAIEPGPQDQQLAAAAAKTQQRCGALLVWLGQQAELAEISRAEWVQQHPGLYNDLQAASVQDDMAIGEIRAMTTRSSQRAQTLRSLLFADRQPGQPQVHMAGHAVPGARRALEPAGNQAAGITAGNPLDGVHAPARELEELEL